MIRKDFRVSVKNRLRTPINEITDTSRVSASRGRRGSDNSGGIRVNGNTPAVPACLTRIASTWHGAIARRLGLSRRGRGGECVGTITLLTWNGDTQLSGY